MFNDYEISLFVDDIKNMIVVLIFVDIFLMRCGRDVLCKIYRINCF